MTERHPEDLPWNDVAADSDVPPGSSEPDPAEVVGDDDDAEDIAAHRVPDPYEKYRPETLDERLAEEEPEATLGSDRDPEAGELQAPEQGGGDVERGDEDGTDGLSDEPAAEDAAVHIRRRA